VTGNTNLIVRERILVGFVEGLEPLSSSHLEGSGGGSIQTIVFGGAVAKLVRCENGGFQGELLFVSDSILCDFHNREPVISLINTRVLE
jgi:hypothetical protein